MYVRNLSGDEFPAQITRTVESEINTNSIMSATIQPTKANLAFLEDMSEVWHIVDDEDTVYVPIYFKKKGIGQHMQADIKAIPLFFDEMNVQRIYERYDQSFTAHAYFTLIFTNSGYGFMLHDAFPAQSFQGVGEGATRLDEFKRGIERYGIEFEIVGATVHLRRLIGNDTQFRYEYRLNASNIVQEVDANELWTYARGYGDYGDGEGGEDWQNAKLFREYTSPLATLIGKRDAPPIKNGNITTLSTMDEQLRILVNDSLKISATADIHSLEKQGYPIAQAQLGDRSFLIDGRIDFDEEVRVVRKRETRNWKGELIGLDLTFGSHGIVRRYQSKLEGARKDITDFLEGRKKLPYNSLDAAVQAATKALQSAQTELIFDKGIIGRDPDNPNLLTVFNSAGLGVSTDGGATFENAITGRGIVADAINVGTLRGILIEGVEIRGSLFESREDVNGYENYIRMTNNMLQSHGRYTRTWGGVEETATINLGIRRGQMWISNEDNGYNLYFTERGLSTSMAGAIDQFTSGTLEFHSQRFNENSRGVTLHSSWGAVALVSDFSTIVTRSNLTNNIESNEYSVYIRPYRLSRPGTNEFRFWVKEGPDGDSTDGVLSYGRFDGTWGAGIRFGKGANRDIVYITNNNGDIGTGSIRANQFIGDLAPAASYAYVRAERLRVVQAGADNLNFAELQFSDALCNSIRYHGTGDMYIGVSNGELRVTNNLRWNDGSPGYRTIRAAGFIEASSEDYKEDITPWDYDALSVIMNEVQTYQYKFIGDEHNLYRRGLIVERETPAEFISEKGINTYEMNTWSLRAIQQLGAKVAELENKLLELESA